MRKSVVFEAIFFLESDTTTLCSDLEQSSEKTIWPSFSRTREFRSDFARAGAVEDDERKKQRACQENVHFAAVIFAPLLKDMGLTMVIRGERAFRKQFMDVIFLGVALLVRKKR